MSRQYVRRRLLERCNVGCDAATIKTDQQQSCGHLSPPIYLDSIYFVEGTVDARQYQTVIADLLPISSKKKKIERKKTEF